MLDKIILFWEDFPSIIPQRAVPSSCPNWRDNFLFIAKTKMLLKFVMSTLWLPCIRAFSWPDINNVCSRRYQLCEQSLWGIGFHLIAMLDSLGKGRWTQNKARHYVFGDWDLLSFSLHLGKGRKTAGVCVVGCGGGGGSVRARASQATLSFACTVYLSRDDSRDRLFWQETPVQGGWWAGGLTARRGLLTV